LNVTSIWPATLAKFAGTEVHTPFAPHTVSVIVAIVMVGWPWLLTVTAAAPDWDLSAFEVATMLIVPSAFAVTVPVLSTLATVLLDDDHVTLRSTPGSALTVAVNCSLSPTFIAAFGGATVTPRTTPAVVVGPTPLT
jgi:hypothetical protein